MKTTNKEYLILGDNNYWFSTLLNLDDAKSELALVKKEIKQGKFPEMSDASEVYLYEATELKRLEV